MTEQRELDKTYDPREFEDRIYKTWKDGGYFRADAKSEKEAFTIVMPPPNVTGELHLGHAINNTLQDVLIRWKRMDGYEALWVPGMDHASISTEARVVDKLNREGIQKEDLTREEFLEEAWEWTEKYGGTIKHQLEQVGVSCDWSRERFTLDRGLSDAVTQVFINLYEKGLIYRGDRIVNWCPSCGTSVSDIEVEHEDMAGKLYHINYPVDGEDGFVQIATTRPETLLGDLAVAVNPQDDRYRDLIGKNLILPLVGRKIPVITDDYVEMEFGTGAVKITPSHDPNDFEVGARHDLGQCIIMEGDGTISESYGPYSGKDRFEARAMIVKDLEDQGLLVKIEEHEHSVGHCERCETVIEPLVSKQWFVKMEDMAKPAKEAYENGDLKLYPDHFGRLYTNWLDGIRDWNISRQLWWGHRLPVYYCNECGEYTVSKTMPESCKSCDSKDLRQDEDTLDTWFSSALWPFSTLGWPDETEDMKKFFPTDVLVTGYDIIFFWVIRMVFSSIEQTGQLPFKDVYFNGLVRDAEGRKMSKSLDNGIDPIDVIEEYGADALRFMLVSGNTPGNDMRFYIERVEGARNFANKLWNASRFVMMHLDEDVEEDLSKVELESIDYWILTKLDKTIKSMERNLSRYDLGIAGSNIYEFIWSEFCDWYIEMAKVRLFSEDESRKGAIKATLLYTLKAILKLLHPFMPFITEEIYSYLPGHDDMIIVSQWPKVDSTFVDEEAEKLGEIIKEAVSGVRNAKSELNIPPSKKANFYIHLTNEDLAPIFINNAEIFNSLAGAEDIILIDEKLKEEAITVVRRGYEIFIPLEGLVDFEKELKRMEAEKEKLEGEIQRAQGKLNNESFTSKAPEHIVQAERDKLIGYQELYDEVSKRIKELSSR